ncbi:SMI1/KNR4 family protein [Actinomadura hibisca]|uniref:SMI1/KNR4 family protein n=1 Tax=Actinomadura hibisca TaxID=68565 RepID=UPI00082F81DE|nr:SMI1/KNR4 family protein [Actinomadura hibisca]
MTHGQARRVAEQIVAGAPAGWTGAVLDSTAGQGGVSVAGSYAVPGATAWAHAVPSLFGELTAVAQAVRAERGWERTSLEFAVRPSGEFTMVAFHDAVTSLRGRDGGFEAVLDPDARLPEPGDDQPGSTAAPAGDADLAAARFRAYLERRAAILGRREPLPPPAPSIAEAERRIGLPLPADLRALYEIADGDAIDYSPGYLLAGNTWLSAETAAAIHEDQRQPVWHGWELGWDWVVFDADPPETVRRCGGHPGWIPFGSGEDGNYLAVDLAPARNGRPGQVIRVGRDYDQGPEYVAESVTALLGLYLEQLDKGDHEIHDGHLYLQEPVSRFGPERVVGEIPDQIPPRLQALHVNDAASPVDLAPLRAAPDLRLLHLNRCATADLGPVRDLPVNSLRATLTGDADLAPLRGHRDLTALDLASAAPVSIAPLRDVPNLYGLDLSGADVADPHVLADLPGLRYLALTAAQWTAVLDAGQAPPALAAACLAGEETTLEQALAWAARLGLDTGDAIRITGTVG